MIGAPAALFDALATGEAEGFDGALDRGAGCGQNRARYPAAAAAATSAITATIAG